MFSQITLETSTCFLKAGLSFIFHWGEASIWPLWHKAQIDGVFAVMVVLLVSPISTQDLWSSSWGTFQFVVTSLSPACSVCLGGQLWEESCLFKMSSFLELWRPLFGTFSAADFLYSLLQICLWALQAVPSTSWLVFFSLICMVSCEMIKRDGRYLSSISSIIANGLNQGCPNFFHWGPNTEKYMKGRATIEVNKINQCRSIMLDYWICLNKNTTAYITTFH